MLSVPINQKRNNTPTTPTFRKKLDAQWNALSLSGFRQCLLPDLPLDSAENPNEANEAFTVSVQPTTSTATPDEEPIPVPSKFAPQSGHQNRSTAYEAQSPSKYGLTLSSSTAMSGKDLDACFTLIESTSSAAYKASSTGWHPRRKKAEMKLLDMKYLLLRPFHHRSSSVGVRLSVEAFLSFMVTMEDGCFVVYIYEIHLSRKLQGQSVGTRMMEVVEGAGKRAGCQKAMLTVWRSNKGARRFYERLGWGEDEFSPGPRKMRGGRVMECEYVIMSKELQNNGGKKP